MILKKVRIKNFKSIIDSGDIEFSKDISILAGQNESGKSSILEALEAFYFDFINFKEDDLNFTELSNGNSKIEISCIFNIEEEDDYFDKLISIVNVEYEIGDLLWVVNKLKNKFKEFEIKKIYDTSTKEKIIRIDDQVLKLLFYKCLEVFKKYFKEKDLIEVKSHLRELLLSKEFHEDASLEITPIYLFDDAYDILPDKIAIKNIHNLDHRLNGVGAVRNIEKILGISFEEIASKRVNQKKAITEKSTKKMSNSLSKDWAQRLHIDNEISLTFSLEQEEDEGALTPYVYFFVNTKEDEPLEPRKRSKGFISFLSIWIDLMADASIEQTIFLLDEPGLYLHLKAHQDLLKIFKRLTKKGHQIIYSSHSPSLIDTNRLSNISLVVNDKVKGTQIEKVTSNKVKSSDHQDALKPIIDAMGIDVLKGLGTLQKRNILLEGLSDMYYFQAFQKLFNLESDYQFLPNLGISNGKLNTIISFCVGYNLDWLLIMDNGPNSIQAKENISNSLFDEDQALTDEKIHLIPFNEIEEMFTVKDLNKIDSKIKVDDKKNVMTLIGKKRKIVFAKIFSEKVNQGEIKISDLDESTVANFKAVFDWIDRKFIDKM